MCIAIISFCSARNNLLSAWCKSVKIILGASTGLCSTDRQSRAHQLYRLNTLRAEVHDKAEKRRIATLKLAPSFHISLSLAEWNQLELYNYILLGRQKNGLWITSTSLKSTKARILTVSESMNEHSTRDRFGDVLSILSEQVHSYVRRVNIIK